MNHEQWSPAVPELVQDTGDVCYSLQSDWVTTNRKTKKMLHPEFGLLPLSDEFYYRCKICSAEFLWRNGSRHKAGVKGGGRRP